MFWIIAGLIEKWGVQVGAIIVGLPIIYDVVGIIYLRDLRIKVETVGAWTQVLGLILVVLGKYAKRWGR